MKTNHTFIERDVMNFVNKELSKTLPEYFIRQLSKTKWDLQTRK